MEGVQQDRAHVNGSEETRRGDNYGCWPLWTVPVLSLHHIDCSDQAL